jgi:hypothetical protein
MIDSKRDRRLADTGLAGATPQHLETISELWHGRRGDRADWPQSTAEGGCATVLRQFLSRPPFADPGGPVEDSPWRGETAPTPE